MIKHTNGNIVTVQTEVTEAFTKWAEDPTNRTLFTGFMWKLDEDPYSPLSGALLAEVLEMMEKYSINPTRFELDNMFSALIANDNWKRLTQTLVNQHRLAALLLTEMTRDPGSDAELRMSKWDVFQQWVGIENCVIPDRPGIFMAEKLFGPAWALLYGESLSTNFVNNSAIIKEASPSLMLENKPAKQSASPPSDMSV